MLNLYLGIIDEKFNPLKDKIMFAYSYFNNSFLKDSVTKLNIDLPRIFDNLLEREYEYKRCEALADQYILDFKFNYEKNKSITYPYNFYKIILFHYYFTVINFTYARYLYIKKFMSIHFKESFLLTTFEENLPNKFENKEDFFNNLFTNIKFIEWFNSIIIENLKFNNVSINRSKSKVSLNSFKSNKVCFWKGLYNLLTSRENLLKPHRIIFFLIDRFFQRLPYSFKCFQNIHGVSNIRSFVYSLILNVRAYLINNKINHKKERMEKQINLKNFQDPCFSSEFKNILDCIITHTCPRSHNEFFAEYIEKIEKNYTTVSGKIRFDFTAIRNDAKTFKHAIFWLNGEKLIFCQHGSNYCTTENSWIADSYEYLGDYFINWGNVTPKHKQCKFIVMPSPHLSRIMNKHKFIHESLILVGTNQRQTMDGICMPEPSYMIDYLVSKENFIRKLDVSVIKNLFYRPWPIKENDDFNDQTYIKNIFPNISILNGNLTKEMLKTKLLVLDHYGTSFYEAMASNTPVIIYFGYPEVQFMLQAQEMFDDFKQIGVYHDDSMSAAAYINKIWNNIDTWWKSELVQQVRQKFNNLYALCGNNCNQQWNKLIWEIR